MTARLLRESARSSTQITGRAGGAGVSTLRVLGSLTPRDRFLLDLLAEHQLLTTTQLIRVAFPSRTMAQRRLLRLHQLRVLDRFRWNQIVGSTDWHYTLGPVGEAIVAARNATNPPSAAAHARRVERLAASLQLDHLLGINDVFTRLAAHSLTQPDTVLETWRSEKGCAEYCGAIVRPDGYGCWREGNRSVRFFFEYDTGSEPLTKVVAKLPGYDDLAIAGVPEVLVLFWLPTARREANLQAAITRAHSSVATATTSADLVDAHAGNPAGPVWLTGTGQPRRTLLDLAPRPQR